MLDVMIAVASLALAWASCAGLYSHVVDIETWKVSRFGFWDDYGLLSKMHTIQIVQGFAIAALIPLTFGYLLFRLCGRRPPSPRMSRHPGFVAATSAAAMILLICLLNLAKAFSGFKIRRGHVPWVIDFYPSVGYVVMGSWLALAFTGRWHRDRRWFEWPGIVLGWAWIATALIEWIGLAFRLEVERI